MADLREERVVQHVEGSGTGYAPDAPLSPAAAAGSTAVTRRTSVTDKVSGNETARRIVIFLFGIIQAVIVLRFTFLLLDAREANGLVSAVLSFSQLFVGPFEGIFRTDALHQGGSVLELASITAFVGWTIVEALALAILQIVTRQPEGTAY